MSDQPVIGKIEFAPAPGAQQPAVNWPIVAPARLVELQRALERIADQLRRAGASLPAAPVESTVESAMRTGLSIALALVEEERAALNSAPSRLVPTGPSKEGPGPVRTEPCVPMHAGPDGWTEWTGPINPYLMECCDCGLRHEAEFRIVTDKQYKPDGSWDAAWVNDSAYSVVLRMRRVPRPARGDSE